MKWIKKKELKKKEVQQVKHKLDFIVISLLILSALLVFFSLYAPSYFTVNYKSSASEGQLGDKIGGLMSPFVALAGVFITFLAFYMQYKANNIQIGLFNQNQKEQNQLLKEQMFFRLLDNLNQRIINFTYRDSFLVAGSRDETVSYEALNTLIGKFKDKIDYQCPLLGRRLLAKIPEQIDITHYRKIYQATTIADIFNFEQAEELKDTIIKKGTSGERWEYLKNLIGNNNDNLNLNSALKSISHAEFYNIDFKERENLYITSYDELYAKYGGFMDGYTKNLTYLINFITQIPNGENLFFIDYLKSTLSTQETILIFYFCSSTKSNEKIRSQVRQINLLDGILDATDKFIAYPSEELLTREIAFVLSKKDAS